MKNTWNAGQIGLSFGAYSGKTVSFMFDGALIKGTLDRSDGSMNGHDGKPWNVLLVVDGTAFMVPNPTMVEVA